MENLETLLYEIEGIEGIEGIAEIEEIIVLDTSALIKHLNYIIKTYDNTRKVKFLIHYVVLEELDSLKNSKDSSLKYNARKAIKFIEKDIEKNKIWKKILFDMKDYSSHKMLDSYDSRMFSNIPDNQILRSLYNHSKEKYNSQRYYLLTDDINMRLKCKALNLEYVKIDNKKEEYKGYRFIKGNTEYINNFYSNIENEYLIINEYVIIQNTDTDEKYKILRYDGQQLQPIILPNICRLKHKNPQQLIALDILFNKNMPIKVIAGTYGSGKTYLAVKASETLLDNNLYNKMLLVRNPIPADMIDIGALPGDKWDKVGAYFKPMTQYLENQQNLFDIESEKEGKSIEFEIISFMKGISVDNTIMLVDEAEDLNEKLIKLLGTRIGKNSCIIFTGDYKQAESIYKQNNGLLSFINKCKGNPLVGIVVLDEDIRSEASKIFADM